MKEYYGYRSYAAWNQSLWLSNDYGLEQYMRDKVSKGTKRQVIINEIWNDVKGTRTDDGIRWSKRSIKEWVNEWCDEAIKARLINNGRNK